MKAIVVVLAAALILVPEVLSQSKDKQPSHRTKNQPSINQLRGKDKKLLDRLMLRLKRESNATGWIRIDLERRRVDEGALTDLVVRYLKSNYGAEFDRVSVMGTYRLAQEMELFIVPRDGDPIPFPEKTSKSKYSKRGWSR